MRRAILSLVAALVAVNSVGAQTLSTRMEKLRRQHDAVVRQTNSEHDWWLVSTTGYGRTQHRFYVDRSVMTSMEPISRAWIDHYEMSSLSKLSHDKFLLVARCDDAVPQLWFKEVVNYTSGGGSPKTSRQITPDWHDVVPDSSQKTLWRFTCHSEPANAIVYVPDGPVSDATRAYHLR